jgi:thymidylate kinase
MQFNALKLVYAFLLLATLQLSSYVYAGDSEEKHLIIIDGLSGMGKSSTADALQSWFKTDTNKSVARSSIDYFFQSKIYALEIKRLDAYWLDNVQGWDELLEKLRPWERNPKLATVLKFFPFISNFFSKIRPMTPQEVRESCINDEEEFYTDIKSSLFKNDIVIVDHKIDFHDVEKWNRFLRSMPNSPRIAHITLTCDYENYLERNKRRNSSKDIEEHRFPMSSALFSRSAAQHEEACKALVDGRGRVVIDTSDMSPNDVLEAIVDALKAQ